MKLKSMSLNSGKSYQFRYALRKKQSFFFASNIDVAPLRRSGSPTTLLRKLGFPQKKLSENRSHIATRKLRAGNATA